MAREGHPAWKRSPLWPPNWPIRAKLTAVSAGLTFVILVMFGFGVGQLATGQLRENFREETEADAEALAREIFREGVLTPGATSQGLERLLDRRPDRAEVLLLANGTALRFPDAPPLGAWGLPGVAEMDGYQVATVEYPLAADSASISSFPIAFVRIGRDLDALDRTVNTVWLSIVAGILGASLLAGLVSTILSGRALRPLSRLTSAAAEVARTRNPSLSLPEPDGEDEVVELTRSFNEMLSELSAARSEREAALARQREFVADASHELRTPLTSVLANLELLEASGALEQNGPEQETIDSALRSSLRMRRLVADLQILARADAGDQGLREEFDLREVAAAALDEVRPLAGEHTLDLLAGNPVPITGTRDDLYRAILNLVENAVRHTPNGTTVRVEVGAEPSQGAPFVEVSDDGPGIPPELRDRIFDRFVRDAGAADRTAGASTGLGLSIVSAIARQHGGSASVGESPQGGALFRLDLARAPQSENGSRPGDGRL